MMVAIVGFTHSLSTLLKFPAPRRSFACKRLEPPKCIRTILEARALKAHCSHWLSINRSPLGIIVLFTQPNCSHAPLLTLLRAGSLLSSRSRVPSTGTFSAKRCTEAKPGPSLLARPVFSISLCSERSDLAIFIFIFPQYIHVQNIQMKCNLGGWGAPRPPRKVGHSTQPHT
jgi:hypothetical protein